MHRRGISRRTPRCCDHGPRRGSGAVPWRSTGPSCRRIPPRRRSPGGVQSGQRYRSTSPYGQKLREHTVPNCSNCSVHQIENFLKLLAWPWPIHKSAETAHLSSRSPSPRADVRAGRGRPLRDRGGSGRAGARRQPREWLRPHSARSRGPQRQCPPLPEAQREVEGESPMQSCVFG